MSRVLRALEAQRRICSVLPHDLPVLPEDHYHQLATLLVDGCEDALLLGGSRDVWHRLRFHTDTRGTGIEFVINLGAWDMPRNQKRSKDFPHFERIDGAWFDFALTGFSDKKRSIELISYSFEIRLDACEWGTRPAEERVPCFIRFDLNPPASDNAAVGERCHVHVGSDDFSMPSPLLSPLEILDLFIHGLRPRE